MRISSRRNFIPFICMNQKALIFESVQHSIINDDPALMEFLANFTATDLSLSARKLYCLCADSLLYYWCVLQWLQLKKVLLLRSRMLLNSTAWPRGLPRRS